MASHDESDSQYLGEITACLRRACANDEEARNRAYVLVCEELKRIARSKMSAADQFDISTTMVANDAYLKMIDLSQVSWQDRHHFLRYSCHVIRQILVDYARQWQRQKRNAGQSVLPLHEVPEPTRMQTPEHILALEEALQRLEKNHPDLAELVELHHFGGWTLEELATQVLNTTADTLRHRWTRARTMLHLYLTTGDN